MTQTERRKICLIGECLSQGGAEKAMALLSRFFDAIGFDVHIVVVLDKVEYAYAGRLMNLGKLKDNANGPLNKFRRFMALRKYLRENRFDFIVDFRMRTSFLQEYFIAKWLYDAPTIYTVHSSNAAWYFPKREWQANAIYRDAYAVVAVSSEIEKIVRATYCLPNVTTIYNPVDLIEITQASASYVPVEQNYILAAGRMQDDVKQFGRLVEAYSETSLPSRGIKLVILGNGPDKTALENLILEKNLKDDVLLKGHLGNPYPYMKNAMFFVLSSKREGLPTVILESLACETPVVSFDCVSGPGEIILDRVNGLLIDDQDFEKLARGIELMASDQELYRHCKARTHESVQKFALENIGKQWLRILEID